MRAVCAGCGAVAEFAAGLPFACPAAADGDDVDHVMTRELAAQPGEALVGDATTTQPFARYRHRLSAHAVALENGWTEADFTALVADLDGRIAAIDGAGFDRTPLVRLEAAERELGMSAQGTVWGKLDATSVSGSHKARHLFGILLNLLVREKQTGEPRKPLAIASCGNAALAAAVVARAADWPLQVFVPMDAEPAVLTRLAELQATVEQCPRLAGEVGDPTVARFREAVAQGALPFCCQGNENGLTIEGGETLGYELVEQLAELGQGLDRVLVQVGGGALMSAVVQALEYAVRVGALPKMPRLHAVQTHGCYPLVRAHHRALAELEKHGPVALSDRMRHHRSEFMWPWETTPHSVAHGILDDETYDWRVLVEAMLQTGGSPVLVTEEALVAARAAAQQATGVAVSATGAAGLAGLHTLGQQIGPEERVAVVLSGCER